MQRTWTNDSTCTDGIATFPSGLRGWLRGRLRVLHMVSSARFKHTCTRQGAYQIEEMGRITQDNTDL
jgi:hypothetical protein